jgi:hypothetical protein
VDLDPMRAMRAYYDPDLGAFLVSLRHDGREPLTDLSVEVGGMYSDDVGACVMPLDQGKGAQVGDVPSGSIVVIMIRTQGVHRLSQLWVPMNIRADGMEAELSVAAAKFGGAKLTRR